MLALHLHDDPVQNAVTDYRQPRPLAHSVRGRPSANRAAKDDWRQATQTFVRRISGWAAWRTAPKGLREKESSAMVAAVTGNSQSAAPVPPSGAAFYLTICLQRQAATTASTARNCRSVWRKIQDHDTTLELPRQTSQARRSRSRSALPGGGTRAADRQTRGGDRSATAHRGGHYRRHRCATRGWMPAVGRAGC